MSERTPSDNSDARTVRQEDVIPPPPSADTSTRPREGEQEDIMAGLRASLTRQLTQALGGDGLGLDRLRNNLANASRLSAPSLEPSRVPLPPDRPEDFPEIAMSNDEPVAVSLPLPEPSPQPEQIVGLSGDSSMTFEDFLVDIQVDLRATLLRRQEMERARREQETSNDAGRGGPSSSATSPTLTSSFSDRSSSAMGSPPSSPVRGRHLQHHVPSVRSFKISASVWYADDVLCRSIFH